MYAHFDQFSLVQDVGVPTSPDIVTRTGHPLMKETVSESTGDKPPSPVRPSSLERHQLDRVRPTTRIKGRNTMALPGIDVAMEIALIDQGYAWRVGDCRYQINERVYVVKPNGAAYPESGVGIVSVSAFGMALLRDMIAHRQTPEELERLIQRNGRYTEEVVAEAESLFEFWKGVT